MSVHSAEEYARRRSFVIGRRDDGWRSHETGSDRGETDRTPTAVGGRLDVPGLSGPRILWLDQSSPSFSLAFASVILPTKTTLNWAGASARLLPFVLPSFQMQGVNESKGYLNEIIIRSITAVLKVCYAEPRGVTNLRGDGTIFIIIRN